MRPWGDRQCSRNASPGACGRDARHRGTERRWAMVQPGEVPAPRPASELGARSNRWRRDGKVRSVKVKCFNRAALTCDLEGCWAFHSAPRICCGASRTMKLVVKVPGSCFPGGPTSRPAKLVLSGKCVHQRRSLFRNWRWGMFGRRVRSVAVQALLACFSWISVVSAGLLHPFLPSPAGA